MRVMFKKYAVSLHRRVPFGPPHSSSDDKPEEDAGLEAACLSFLQALVSTVEVLSRQP